jgi:hypothetical protein
MKFSRGSASALSRMISLAYRWNSNFRTQEFWNPSSQMREILRQQAHKTAEFHQNLCDRGHSAFTRNIHTLYYDNSADLFSFSSCPKHVCYSTPPISGHHGSYNAVPCKEVPFEGLNACRTTIYKIQYPQNLEMLLHVWNGPVVLLSARSDVDRKTVTVTPKIIMDFLIRNGHHVNN